MQIAAPFTAVFCLLYVSSGCAADLPLGRDHISQSGLTLPQAKALLLLVLRHQGYQLNKRGMFIDDDFKTSQGQAPHIGYFDFALGLDSSQAGATRYMGYYAVSKKTGDIWELNLCKRYLLPELERAQRLVMSRTKISFADERSERRGLGCPAD